MSLENLRGVRVLCDRAGVPLCEVVSEDKQSMARLPELERLAEKHGLPIKRVIEGGDELVVPLNVLIGGQANPQDGTVVAFPARQSRKV
mgnify:CR=1 FL=1